MSQIKDSSMRISGEIQEHREFQGHRLAEEIQKSEGGKKLEKITADM
jgi:hypothetical protein